MRLIQVMAGAPQGGAEKFFERHAIAMTEAGVDQIAVIRRDAVRAGLLREAGVAVEERRFGGLFDRATRPSIVALARGFEPDVVLTWMSRATAKTPKGAYTLCARFGGYYDLKYYRHCDHLVGNTPGIRRYLVEQGWPAERAHYLPNFVDEVEAAPVDRAELDTPHDATVIFALGRLHAVKGFDVLLEAMAGLPNAILWLAGEGPERVRLDRQAADLGLADRVRFLGWRRDIPALMAATDIMVCPSRHEPLGNVVLEGWAARKPVISTATAGPGEMIEDGVNGLLVPIEDAAALRDAVTRLSGDDALCRTIAAGGHETLTRRFSKKAVVAQYLDFFDRIVERR